MCHQNLIQGIFNDGQIMFFNVLKKSLASPVNGIKPMLQTFISPLTCPEFCIYMQGLQKQVL